MTVRNGFDVWFDDGLTYFIVTRPWPFLLLLVEDGFSFGAAIEGSTAVEGTGGRSREILPWTQRACQFVEIVDFAFSLKNKSHDDVKIIPKI